MQTSAYLSNENPFAKVSRINASPIDRARRRTATIIIYLPRLSPITSIPEISHVSKYYYLTTSILVGHVRNLGAGRPTRAAKEDRPSFGTKRHETLRQIYTTLKFKIPEDAEDQLADSANERLGLQWIEGRGIVLKLRPSPVTPC